MRTNQPPSSRLRWLLFLGAALMMLLHTGEASAQQPAFCDGYPQLPGAGQWQSSRVVFSGDRLTYPADAAQNRIPDFSYAGYRYGQVSLPSVAEVLRLTPAPGDNTARIQEALDQVGARTPDSRGIRGALVLAPGVYEIQGTVKVDKSGVVLRGSGSGGDPSNSTILQATGDTPHQRTVVILGTGSTAWTEVSPRTDITTSFVQVGSQSFDVASASGFAVGDNVIIHHPTTQAWIDALNGGGSPPWTPGTHEIVYNRRITAVSGNRVTLDVPVYNHLNRSLSQSYLTKVTSNHITESGIEDLRVDIVTAGGEDENHAWNAIGVVGAQDSWVGGIVALHFGYAGVRTSGAVRITVADSQALDPVGIRTGGRFYNFSGDARSQMVLFSRCHVTGARHGYVTNGEASVSDVVFYRSTANGGHDMEGGHRQWAQGILFDNVREDGSGSVRLINRGSWGTSHGWAAAHSVSWRFNKASLIQQPPTAQNYGITDTGSFSTSFPFSGPVGFTEKQAGTLVPDSLYEAQMCDRLTLRGPFKIIARHSGKAVVVEGASTADGADVIQWTYGGSNTNDEWIFQNIGGRFYNILNRNSGKALNVSGASTANGGDVIQWPYTSTAPANDEWKVESLGGGFYRLINRNSGKALNVAGASTADGANVDQWDWRNVNQQKFQIIAVP